MDSVHKMGTPWDMRMREANIRKDSARRRRLVKEARSMIHDNRKAVSNSEFEALLQPMSLVPTVNAFSQRLSALQFDFFDMFVVDVLHEVELGVWKSLFVHLVRILHGCGNEAVTEFNRRFRQVPTFSNSTIRKFSEDVASMKRLAARDFEDILQCCIPVFQGLLPDHCNERIQKLLFTFAYWHALAKLQQHTSATLKLLTTATTKLGNELRDFQSYTSDLEVFETTREFNARQRQASSKAKRNSNSTGVQVSSARKQCKLNLNTPKFHSLGDYVAIISRYGTTDSFSTQTTELQHRKIKAQWARTNKRNAVQQMTQIGDIGDSLDNIAGRVQQLESYPSSVPLSSADNDSPYEIGQSDRTEDSVCVPIWVNSNSQDQAVKFFIPNLKQHLLSRLTGDLESTEIGKISFQNDRLYFHATLRINYTSYDVRRQQDVVNPGTPCRFILLPVDCTGDSTAHPFMYAKVLGIYHTKVRYCNRPPRRMDFLWVQWLDYDNEEPGGWNISRLDRVRYSKCRNDTELSDAFGFVDPANVVRAVHLIPDFWSGINSTLLGATPASLACDDHEFGDYRFHYVNRFVDRDMVMRYIGGGIGHFNQTPPLDETIEIETTYDIDDTPEAENIAEDLESVDKDQASKNYQAQVESGDEEDDIWGRDSGSESGLVGAEDEDEDGDGDRDFFEDSFDL